MYFDLEILTEFLSYHFTFLLQKMLTIFGMFRTSENQFLLHSQE